MAAYYSLVTWSHGRYWPQFGDFDKSVVQQEMLDTYGLEACRILECADASQDALDTRLTELNERFGVSENEAQDVDRDVASIMNEVAIDRPIDVYGYTMSAWFQVSNTLHFDHGICCPSEWEFYPSPMGKGDDDTLSHVLSDAGTVALGLVGFDCLERREACAALDLDY
jgi:hypothetical protein